MVAEKADPLEGSAFLFFRTRLRNGTCVTDSRRRDVPAEQSRPRSTTAADLPTCKVGRVPFANPSQRFAGNGQGTGKVPAEHSIFRAFRFASAQMIRLPASESTVLALTADTDPGRNMPPELCGFSKEP